MAPAARVLADAVAELGGERVAEAATSELCLRVVVNPSIMAGDLAAVEAAVLGIMDNITTLNEGETVDCYLGSEVQHQPARLVGLRHP